MKRARLFIIGRDIGYTLSPAMYRRALSGIIDVEYGVVDVKSIEEAVAAIEGCRRDDACVGFNVTKPYKVDVVRYIDEVDDEAGSIGAVNTVSKNGSVLIGHNTDWYGVIASLERHGYSGADEALIIGAGGAARAAVYALRGSVGRLYITSKTGVTAVKLAMYAEKLGVEAVAGRARPEFYEVVVPRVHLLVNASPASGRRVSPIPPSLIPRLPRGAVVMDMVYTPPRTRLIVEAERHGYTAVDGLWMLSYQASRNVEIWFGLRIPAEEMRAHALSALGEKS